MCLSERGMIAIRVLVVEDEKPLLNIISKRLKEEGYSVDSLLDGNDGLHCAYVYEYDVCVLDIMLPNVDGITILKAVRQKCPDTKVLLLTALDSIQDRVSGLDAGADDYLVKPFSLEELLARVRVLIRRQGNGREAVLQAGDLSMDTMNRMVKRQDKTIDLTAKEYAVLEYLLRNKGRTLTRSQIAEHVWNFEFDSGTNIVDVYIRYIRSKMDDGWDEKLIHTIRGVGYALRSEEG
jgi:DNA-binding response OmpR family regulator